MICTTLNHIDDFRTLGFTDTGCIFTSALASLVDIFTEIMSSTIGLSICAITERIKKYKLIIKKKKKKHNEIALLAKTKSNCIKGFISRSLSDSSVGRNYFLLIEVLRKYDDMKEELINLKLHKLIKTFNILINNVMILFEV